MIGRRFYVRGPSVVRRVLGWARRHPVGAVWLLGAAVLVVEKGL